MEVGGVPSTLAGERVEAYIEREGEDRFNPIPLSYYLIYLLLQLTTLCKKYKLRVVRIIFISSPHIKKEAHIPIQLLILLLHGVEGLMFKGLGTRKYLTSVSDS